MSAGNSSLKVQILGDNRSLKRALDGSQKDIHSFSKTASGVASRAFGLFKVAAMAAAGAAGIAGAAVLKVGVQFNAFKEQAQIAFTQLIGSSTKAKKFIGDLQKFAAATPFEFPGLVDASRLLLGVGITSKKVIPMLTDLGDAAGALGIQQDAFQRITLALSQSITAGKIKLGDMNQLMTNGLPIYKLLGEALHKPVKVIQDMITHGKLLTADVLPKLLAQMHKDYGGAMEKQSRTLSGLFSSLKDNLRIFAGEATKSLTPLLKNVVGRLNTEFGKLSSAKSWRARVSIVWDDIDAVRKKLMSALFGHSAATPGGTIHVDGLVDQLRKGLEKVDVMSLIMGADRAVPSGSVHVDGIVDKLKQAFAAVDWSGVGGKVGEGLRAGIDKAGNVVETAQQKVDQFVAAIVSRRSQIADAGAQIVAAMFVKLTDIGFWAHHWDLALAVALSVGPGKFARIGGKLVEFLMKPFAKLAGPLGRMIGDGLLGALSAVSRFAPRLANVLLRAVLGAIGLVTREILSPAAKLAASILSGIGNKVTSTGPRILRFALRVAANSALVTLATDVFNKAKSVGSAIVDGIVAGFNAVKGAISSIHIPVPHLNVSTSHGGPGGVIPVPSFSVSWYARGGRVNGPMAMVGEEGPQHPEWVIATNPAYRASNIQNWLQAGKDLGLMGFKEGGRFSWPHKRKNEKKSDFRQRVSDYGDSRGNSIMDNFAIQLSDFDRQTSRVDEIHGRDGVQSPSDVAYDRDRALGAVKLLQASTTWLKSYVIPQLRKHGVPAGQFGRMLHDLSQDLLDRRNAYGSAQYLVDHPTIDTPDSPDDPTTPAGAKSQADYLRGVTEGMGRLENYVLDGPGDIGSGGYSALGAAGSNGATVIIQTLHPGDPNTLAAIAKAANGGNELVNRGRMYSPRARVAG